MDEVHDRGIQAVWGHMCPPILSLPISPGSYQCIRDCELIPTFSFDPLVALVR